MCPSVFKNGKIVWHCSRQHGDTCTYSCDQGCTESNTAWLNCKDDSTWDKNTDSLCTNCEYITDVRIFGLNIFGPRYAKTRLRAYADSEGSDQPSHPGSLIMPFAVRKQNYWVL